MSNEPTNANDFLFATGGKAASFENLDDSIRGIVIDARVRQQTDIETNEPKSFADGTPMMQLVIRLQTDERDSSVDDDDGVRTLYAKGGSYRVATGEGKSMRDAIADAIKSSGGSSLEEGDELVVAFTGLGEKKNRAYSAPKLYTAGWRRPAAKVSGADLFGDGEG